MKNKWLHNFRIAYKRLKRQYSVDSDEYMFGLAFLAQLSSFHKEYSSETNFDCLNKYFIKVYTCYKQRLEKEIQGAKDFAATSNFNEIETQDWLNKTKWRFESQLRQIRNNFKLFDCKINEKEELELDFGYIKNIIEKLTTETFSIYPIDELKIICAVQAGIGKFKSKFISNGTYDFLTNGTYFSYTGGNGCLPCGTIISEEKTFESDMEKVMTRGSIVILSSGIINIAYTKTNSVKSNQMQHRESFPEIIDDIPELKETDEVFEFIGGGALLIEKSQPISGNELYSTQQFDQMYDITLPDGSTKPSNSKNGFDSRQLSGKRNRILIAKYNEIPFLILINEPAQDAQKKLCQLGFSNLVCFDGGGEIYFITKDKDIKTAGRNSPSGFAAKGLKL